MELEFELVGAQINGARDYQEDAFLITHLNDHNGKSTALVVVADGMGGHTAGNVASNMAVQAFNKHMSAHYPDGTTAELLEQSIVIANNSIKEIIAETPALEGMGCTMVAAILEDNKITWASIGDSHLYLIRNKELIKLNDDHSYGGFLDRMEAQGTPIEPEPNLSRNMLMSAITGEDISEIDVPEEPFELRFGDRLILCSDGMDALSSGKLIQFSEWSKSPKKYVDSLMQAVTDLNIPHQDNTTAIVVDVIEKTTVTTSTQSPKVKPVTEASNEKTNRKIFKPVSKTVTKPLDQTHKIRNPLRNKTSMLAGITTITVILIAVGIYFMMNKKMTNTSVVKTADVETIEKLDTEESINKETITTEERIAETKDETVTGKTKETESIKTKIISVSSQIIQDNLKSGEKAPLMIIIPAGKFQMGSNSARYTDERPQHEIKVEKFAVSQYEITAAEYNLFARATRRKSPDSLYRDKKIAPVIFVSWDDAYYYTKWLSEQTGQKYRLPSEAEWEYMASTGKKSPFWWGYDQEPNRAHCFDCGNLDLDPRKPTYIGSFKPNAFGVYDTVGNVAEWVHDCWHNNYNGAPKIAEVWEGGDCTYRVVRGGAYSSPLQSTRHAKRDKFKSNQTYDHIGIRLVREIR